MESTTISAPAVPVQMCATSMPLRPFFSSTALMLEEPTSRPTMAFRSESKHVPAFTAAPAALGSRLRFRFALISIWLDFSSIHWSRVDFLKAPAIAQLEAGNLLLADVLVKRVRTHAQVLRRLANVHHFSRVGHNSFCLFPLHPFPLRFPRPAGFVSRDCLALIALSEGFRCSEHISAPKNPGSERFSAFLWVLCPFLGIAQDVALGWNLYIVDMRSIYTISSSGRAFRTQSPDER
jgi:hypothetical protein